VSTPRVSRNAADYKAEKVRKETYLYAKGPARETHIKRLVCVHTYIYQGGPRVSTPRVSTPRVSTPRVSTPRVSRNDANYKAEIVSGETYVNENRPT